MDSPVHINLAACWILYWYCVAVLCHGYQTNTEIKLFILKIMYITLQIVSLSFQFIYEWLGSVTQYKSHIICSYSCCYYHNNNNSVIYICLNRENKTTGLLSVWLVTSIMMKLLMMQSNLHEASAYIWYNIVTQQQYSFY